MICLMHFTLEYLNSETASFPYEYEHLHKVDKARDWKRASMGATTAKMSHGAPSEGSQYHSRRESKGFET